MNPGNFQGLEDQGTQTLTKQILSNLYTKVYQDYLTDNHLTLAQCVAQQKGPTWPNYIAKKIGSRSTGKFPDVPNNGISIFSNFAARQNVNPDGM